MTATPGLQLDAGDMERQGLCRFQAGESVSSNIQFSETLECGSRIMMLCSLSVSG